MRDCVSRGGFLKAILRGTCIILEVSLPLVSVYRVWINTYVGHLQVQRISRHNLKLRIYNHAASGFKTNKKGTSSACSFFITKDSTAIYHRPSTYPIKKKLGIHHQHGRKQKSENKGIAETPTINEYHLPPLFPPTFYSITLSDPNI